MANKIKYNSGIDADALNMGNWSVGVSNSGMGPSSSTGFKNGIKAPAGGYVIYTDGPTVRVANDDAELVSIMNKLGANVLTAEAALMFAKSSGILVLNDTFNDVSTEGLVAYMDAKHVASFPKDGTTWYSLSDNASGLSDLRVLGYAHNYGAAKIYDYLAANTQFTSLGDYSAGYSSLQNLDVASTAINYDLVVVESAAWSFGSDVMQKLKELVDAGVSVIANGNDNRTNVFVRQYAYGDLAIRQAHDIQMESDSLIGLDGQTFPYGSTDAIGGIIELQNGAIPLYRRADNNLIMGFVYHNEENGASLFFDQEWHNNFTNDIYMAALNYVVKNIGHAGKFKNTPVFDQATKTFEFDQVDEWFNLSTTAVEDLSGSFTLMGFCKQDETGLPHQTVIATATNYRNGAKLMSRYHGAVALWLGNNDGSDSFLLSSGVNITNDGKWHHIAATRDADSGEIKIYVDGELKNADTYVTGPLSMEGPAAIGVDYHSTGYYHTGNIGSVKAYNRVLSDEEIKRDCYNGNISTNGLAFAMDPADVKTWGPNGPATTQNLKSLDHGLNILGNQWQHLYSEENGGTFKMGQNSDGTLLRSTYLQPNNGQYTEGPFNFSEDAGYSVSIWVKRTAFGTWQSGGRTNYDGIWNYYWNHNLHFSGAHTGYNAIQGTGFNTPYYIEMDKWYHVTTTHDNNTNEHKVYVNGELIHKNYFGPASLSDGLARRFYIGNWDAGWAMVGNIGTCQVYNRAITDEEVIQNYQAYKSRY